MDEATQVNNREKATDDFVNLVDHVDFTPLLDRVDAFLPHLPAFNRSALYNAVHHLEVRNTRLDSSLVLSIIKAYIVDRIDHERHWCALGFRHNSSSTGYATPSTFMILRQLVCELLPGDIDKWNHKLCYDESTWCIPTSLIGLQWRIEETAKLVDYLYHRLPKATRFPNSGHLVSPSETETISASWHAEIVVNVLLEETLKTLWCIQYEGQDVKKCVGHDYALAFSQLECYHCPLADAITTLPFFNMMFYAREESRKLIDSTFDLMDPREWEQSRYWWSSKPATVRTAATKQKFLVALALFKVAADESVKRGIAPTTKSKERTINSIAHEIHRTLMLDTGQNYKS